MRWDLLRGNAFYRYDRSRGLVVVYWDGKIIVEEPVVKPYAFVNANISWKIRDKVARLDSTDFVNIKGVPVDRFEVENPKTIARVRDRHAGYWKTHEADIPFVRRLMIDGLLEPGYGTVQESVVYWDIEVNDEKGFPEPGDPLVSLAYSVGGGKVKFLHVSWYDSPEQLVEEFMKDTVYRGYTVFSAWNVGFDVEYFVKWFEWIEANGDLEIAVKLMEPLDLLTAYRQTVKGLSSYSLGSVAFHEGMVEEAEAKRSRKAIHEMTEKELEEYNTRDVDMIVRIDGKYGFSETAISLAQTVGLVVSQAYYPDEYRLVATRVADNFLIPRAREYGVVMPNSSKAKKSGYEGALVLSPKVGFHRRVAYYDVESMYPNVIVYYKIDVPGFKGQLLPEVMRELLEKRKRYKLLFKETGDAKYDVAQKVYKILANSMYGVLGVEGSRYFDEGRAAMVTAKGREVLQKAILTIGEMGYEIYYGDSVTGDSKVVYMTTDSMFHEDIIAVGEGARVATNMGEVEIAKLFKDVTMRLGEKEYYIPEEPIYVLAFDTESRRLVWGKVKYVMRHKTNKKVYKVCATNEMCVKVTEDHSIIVRQNILSQRSCRYGCGEFVEISPVKLLQEKEKNNRLGASLIIPNKLDYKVETLGMPKIFYEFMGLLLADGSTSVREVDKRRGKLYYVGLSLGLDADELERKLLKRLKDTGLISNYYKRDKGDYMVLVTPIAEYVKRFYNDFTRLGTKKKIPEFIFKEEPENISAFLRGYFTGDGTVIIRRGRPIIRASTVDRELAYGIMRLLLQIGVSASVYRGNTVNSYSGRQSETINYYVTVNDCRKFAEKVGFLVERKTMRLNCSTATSKKVGDEVWLKRILSIESVEYDGYVYDIEVEGVHNFFANWILVHNTDSLFVRLGEGDDPEVLAEEVSERISPFKVKLEGVGDVLFVAKKRYIMRTYDGEEIVRGLEIRRGDWSDFTKMVVSRVVDMIFEGKGRLEIEKYLSAVRSELYRGEHDEKLVITKSIDPRRKYKVEAEHVKAWKKMGAPKTVTSVSYVLVRGGVEPVTDVGEVSRFRGRIDYKRYWALTKQAVDRLLKAVGSGGGMEVWMSTGGKNKNLAG